MNPPSGNSITTKEWPSNECQINVGVSPQHLMHPARHDPQSPVCSVQMVESVLKRLCACVQLSAFGRATALNDGCVTQQRVVIAVSTSTTVHRVVGARHEGTKTTNATNQK